MKQELKNKIKQTQTRIIVCLCSIYVKGSGAFNAENIFLLLSITKILSWICHYLDMFSLIQIQNK